MQHATANPTKTAPKVESTVNFCAADDIATREIDFQCLMFDKPSREGRDGEERQR